MTRLVLDPTLIGINVTDYVFCSSDTTPMIHQFSCRQIRTKWLYNYVHQVGRFGNTDQIQNDIPSSHVYVHAENDLHFKSL